MLNTSVKILEAGIHLLLEKPMAVSVKECERIIAASRERASAKLMIAYRLHHEPGTLAAIQKVREGQIGKVRFFNSSFSQQVSGQNHRAKTRLLGRSSPRHGPLPLNTVRNIFGAEPIEVFATGVCTDDTRFNFEDTVSVTLKFPDNRVAAFTLSYSGGDVDDFRVVGELGDLFSEPAYQVGSRHGTRTHDRRRRSTPNPSRRPTTSAASSSTSPTASSTTANPKPMAKRAFWMFAC